MSSTIGSIFGRGAICAASGNLSPAGAAAANHFRGLAPGPGPIGSDRGDDRRAGSRLAPAPGAPGGQVRRRRAACGGRSPPAQAGPRPAAPCRPVQGRRRSAARHPSSPRERAQRGGRTGAVAISAGTGWPVGPSTCARPVAAKPARFFNRCAPITPKAGRGIPGMPPPDAEAPIARPPGRRSGGGGTGRPRPRSATRGRPRARGRDGQPAVKARAHHGPAGAPVRARRRGRQRPRGGRGVPVQPLQEPRCAGPDAGRRRRRPGPARGRPRLAPHAHAARAG